MVLVNLGAHGVRECEVWEWLPDGMARVMVWGSGPWMVDVRALADDGDAKSRLRHRVADTEEGTET